MKNGHLDMVVRKYLKKEEEEELVVVGRENGKNFVKYLIVLASQSLKTAGHS